MKRKGMFWKKFLFFLAWILSTVISIAAAYWLMGAIPETEEPRYLARLLHVVQNPLGNYFNNYTPVGIIASFIVTELLFGIIFFSKISEHPMPEESEQDSFRTLEPEASAELEIEFLDLQDTVIAEKKEKEKNALEKDNGADDVDVFLKDDVFLKLFNSGYTMSQINAMMELTTYIPEIDVQQMTKMFSPVMEEDDIRSYIEAFYG